MFFSIGDLAIGGVSAGPAGPLSDSCLTSNEAFFPLCWLSSNTIGPQIPSNPEQVAGMVLSATTIIETIVSVSAGIARHDPAGRLVGITAGTLFEHHSQGDHGGGQKHTTCPKKRTLLAGSRLYEVSRDNPHVAVELKTWLRVYAPVTCLPDNAAAFTNLYDDLLRSNFIVNAAVSGDDTRCSLERMKFQVTFLN